MSSCEGLELKIYKYIEYYNNLRRKMN
ncbi:hypothetical protein CO689_00535 (plasmid) [Staphylococcus simulans]|nr:hypothetical protein CO689_00535 [Staphylococcus simulans]